MVLSAHAAWLAWGATRQSPTLNEPGHLASGLAQWHLLRFEPDCVNPPPVRMLATVPLVLAGCETDWRGLSAAPGQNCAAQLGMDFVRANGPDTQRLVVLARWALIPVSLLGGALCYLWAKRLYGAAAGGLALCLWCCEPNLIAHGQLATTDVAAATALLGATYAFRSWLDAATGPRAAVAGLCLGLALLTKFTLLILLILWPLIWAFTRWRTGTFGRLRHEALGLAVVVFVALAAVNACYAFQGSFRRLGDFEFVSRLFAGGDPHGAAGNRFRATPLAAMPVPLPASYLAGLDLQHRDSEAPHYRSYLAGRWQRGGWWYYYLYAAAVKIPLGCWLLFLAALARAAWSRRSREASPAPRGGGVLYLPAALLFLLVSSHTAVNHHFRYVLPCLGPFLVFSSGVLAPARVRSVAESSAPDSDPLPLRKFVRAGAIGCAAWAALSSVAAAPFNLSYFNELAGGPGRGHRHLLHSNLDWGQGLVAFEEWRDEHLGGEPVFLAYYGYFDPIDYGVNAATAPRGPVKRHDPETTRLVPGWYAISANYLYGCEWGLSESDPYRRFRGLDPAALCGGSIYLFRLEETDSPPETGRAHGAAGALAKASASRGEERTGPGSVR